MKLKVLGCDGGRSVGYRTTSLLFDDAVLIDAGTVQTQLSLEESLAITDIFFTHTHLDHIIDLPFLLDATFDKRTAPLRLHGLKEAMEPMMTHIFNDRIWPNFANLPSPDKGQFTVHHIHPEHSYEAAGLTFTPIAVDHTVPTVGYKVDDGHSAIVFTGDTGPVDRLWEVANATDNLKAVIVDLSFPVEEQAVATISKHMTVDDLAGQLELLTRDCDVYTFHTKVEMADRLGAQAASLTHKGRPLKALRDFDEIVF